MLAKLSKSPWIVHVNCASCNGCDIELLASLTPLYDAERMGVINIGTPKQADILVVTGGINYKNVDILKNIYDQIPSPKAIVAIGACACTGGVFHDCYNMFGGVDKVLPVDVYVPGCCPKVETILDGIYQAASILDQKKLDEKCRNK